MYLNIENKEIMPNIWVKLVTRHSSNPTEALKNYKPINIICKLKKK